MNKFLTPIVGLLAAFVLFFSLNLLVQKKVTGARIDLTEGHLYTLSEGSRAIARSLDEPVRLTLFYNHRQGSLNPTIATYASRVREFLAELAAASNAKVILSTVDPEPFSDDEDRAVQAGLAAIPVGPGGENLYFGLVATSSTDKTQTIPFFNPSSESFLEYDVTKLIYTLSDAPKRTVGIITWLPIDGQQSNPMNPMQRGGGTPPFKIYTQLQDFFNVRLLPTDSDSIPADIDLLLVIHPKNPAPQTLYAIDQYVLRGGRLVAFVDPLCDGDVPPGMNPMQAMSLPKSSTLDPLLGAWGVELLKNKLATDRSSALPVNAGAPGRPSRIDYICWLNLQADRLNSADPITGKLQNVIMATTGALERTQDATTEFEPLISTSTNAQLIESSSVAMFPEPDKLLAEFKSDNTSRTLAARISGKAKTAYPDGSPASPPKTDTPSDQPTPPSPTGTHIAESDKPISVILIADADMLFDQFWGREEAIGPISLGFRKISDNADLLTGAVDNLAGASELSSLRAREKAARPFQTVVEIQKDAQQRFAAKERELKQRLTETQRKIDDLQRARGDSDKGLLLSPEQQKEVENFRAQMLTTRKELREVQHQLGKDIDSLGTRIKGVNIALMPLLVGIGAVGLAAYRASRRAADRKAVASKE